MKYLKSIIIAMAILDIIAMTMDIRYAIPAMMTLLPLVWFGWFLGMPGYTKRKKEPNWLVHVNGRWDGEN